MLKLTKLDNALPLWAIILIVLLGIVALVLAGWGLFSSFKQYTKKENDLFSRILSKKSIDLKKISINTGTVIMVCGPVNENEFFIPMYGFESDKISEDINSLILELESNKTSFANQINKYLEFNKIEINDIKFTIVKETMEEINKELSLDKRGFSK